VVELGDDGLRGAGAAVVGGDGGDSDDEGGCGEEEVEQRQRGCARGGRLVVFRSSPVIASDTSPALRLHGRCRAAVVSRRLVEEAVVAGSVEEVILVIGDDLLGEVGVVHR